ncbi:MurR/RpiR family transcriptional regulator [Cryobacterium aureum]|uniref:MurR/RpiR family transcriptional regulator n=1 Tax=Cryobacterium aureum TaxID=995037 RepID=UPI000CF44B01|nr:MurR/RpiR family transcriptional regulator [Cryobacterium aureum]
MQTVSQILRAHLGTLPRAERMVATALLGNYPAAALDTVASIAADASVSAPTVLRLVERIGFDGYAAFQDALRQELKERSLAPIEQLSDYGADDDPLMRARTVFSRGVIETFDAMNPADFHGAVAMLSSAKNRIYATGGRFSYILAKTLILGLEVLRPLTRYLNVEDRTTLLTDITVNDVIVIVDLRRYQTNTIEFGRGAKARGAKIVLLTDRWMSPLAEHADAVLTCSIDAPHPLDSMVPAMAVTEALLAGVADSLGDTPVERMRRYDAAWDSLGFRNRHGSLVETADAQFGETPR